jgi:5'-phosphate synthase pdxT subunit
VERPLRIGVLALQGAFREHAQMLRRLGAEVVEVRLPEELEGLDGLVIPGGESTTIMRLARIYGLDEAIRRYRGAILGTCAGMIVVDRAHLGLADLEVDRNAYGRQVRSFEADVELEDGEPTLRGVFIRAPRIRDVGDDVEVLGTLDGEPVLVRDGRLLLAAFHPELTDDVRVHERFLEMVREAPHVPDASLASVPRGNSAQARAPEESEVERRERGGAGLRPAGAARSGA